MINQAKKLIVGFKGIALYDDHPVVSAILKKQIDGVVLFSNNIQSPTQLKALTQQLHDYAQSADLPHFIISIDYEGGTVKRLSPDCGFPPTQTAAALAKLSPAAIRSEAERMGDTLLQLGFNLNFSPVVDINVNPQNPIIGLRERAFSSDPAEVIACAQIFIESYNQRGITCVLKHFPGHGSSEADSHLGLTEITRTWQKEELEPYRALLKTPNDALMIMIAHVVNRALDPSGRPASLSKVMTTDLLRTLTPHRFKIIVDDLEMQAITRYYPPEEALRLAMAAGADYFIFGNQLAETDIGRVAGMLRSG